MNVCVFGLWHLGTVTVACLAAVGHHVVGLDIDATTIRDLQAGKPPLFEPELEALVKRGLDSGRLSFTTDIADAVCGAQVVWVTYDTPVDDEDNADVEYVFERVKRLFPELDAGTLVLISSQLPVGTTQRLEQAYAAAYPDKPVSFAYSPENLRLGKAIAVFSQPDRVVVGVRSEADRERIAALLTPITDLQPLTHVLSKVEGSNLQPPTSRIEWMTIESAEMTKHALNAFLATSVTFINEIAALCEQVGADAKEVERGLKTESRIGAKAYLGPGGAFAGGTLARDVSFLTQIGAKSGLPLHLIPAVRVSNDAHKGWVRRKLQEQLGDLHGKRIAIWGLTYKPGTDTLRRSSSVELCEWLATQEVIVRAHDPAAKSLPPELAQQIHLCESALDALQDAEALVIATEWADYRMVSADAVVGALKTPIVIDANRFLAETLGADLRIRYTAVGTPAKGAVR